MPLTKDKYFELIDSNSDYPHFRCALGAYIPGSLYKYFSIPDDSDEARKRFEQLKSGEIWFSKRSGLNDPFEFEHAAYDQDVFTRATLRGKLDVNAMEANRSLYSHVIYDSDNERRFAQELDVSDQVAVYVKLPGSFYISTPVGKYNPDWAIAFNEGSVKHIYFVAETKGNLDTMELRGVENAKIECAKKHFAAISNGSVVYSVVDNYSTLMQLVSN